MDGAQPPIPIGSSGRLEALPLTNAAGNHAIVVRQADTPRALLTGEAGDGDRDRVVVVPLDADVQLHVDGDALAIWLAEGSVAAPQRAIPGWASAVGLLLLLLLLALTVLGSVTAFTWLLEGLGWR
ncbi:MAG: hypothetical protein OEW24_02540 [Chloroflexota bacterium]|nr:hypothetical protein [Chloroflexota bacterium]